MKLLKANLPDKLSDIILIALEDMEWVENHKNYTVEMSVYHSPGGVCGVCFAGGIMARSKGTSCKQCYDPSHFTKRDSNIFGALDSLRNYGISSFLRYATEFPLDNLTKEQENAHTEICKHLELQSKKHERSYNKGSFFYTYQTEDVPRYRHSKAGFKRNMETIAAILQEHNL